MQLRSQMRRQLRKQPSCPNARKVELKQKRREQIPACCNEKPRKSMCCPAPRLSDETCDEVCDSMSDPILHAGHLNKAANEVTPIVSQLYKKARKRNEHVGNERNKHVICKLQQRKLLD
jgi:hypothetical protein